MNENEDRVVQFPRSEPLPENPIQIERQPFAYCKHQSIRLNVHDRTVKCVTCNATLEPFDYLIGNAQDLQRAWSRHAEVTAKVQDVHARVLKLIAEEKSLRGKVKRLREKTEGVVIDVRKQL